MTGYRFALPLVGVALLLVASGCTMPMFTRSDVSVPYVELLVPTDQTTVSLGSTVTVRAVITDSQGIAWTELRVDDKVQQRAAPDAPPVTELTQDLLWVPDDIGPHTVKVVVENEGGGRSESVAVTLHVTDTSLQVTKVAVWLITATPTPTPLYSPTPSPTITPTPSPTGTPAPIPAATPTTAPGSCHYDSVEDVEDEFVKNNDHKYSQVGPGDTLHKVWKLCNKGNCAWDTSYEFVFQSDTLFTQNGQRAFPLPYVVPPDGCVYVSVPVVVPHVQGHHQGQGQLRHPDGRTFGRMVYVNVTVGN